MASVGWPPQRLGIVGVGLIGSSIGLAARRAWPAVEILGVDRPAVVGSADRSACVDQWVSLADLTRCDLVVLAAPATANERVLAALSSAGCRALVTDVGSTKRSLQRVAGDLPIGLRVVGGHPMAGNETGAGSADLFERCTWFVVPFPGSRANDVSRVEAMAEAFGARPARVEADTHDRVMAAVSHAPQIVATVLMQAVGERVGQGGLVHAGRGLADTTRLASCGGEWLSAVFATNPDYVAAALDDVIARLQVVRGQVAAGQDLHRLFAESQAWRDVLYTVRRRE
jgi:prephenate dehydrogenase